MSLNGRERRSVMIICVVNQINCKFSHNFIFHTLLSELLKKNLAVNHSLVELESL